MPPSNPKKPNIRLKELVGASGKGVITEWLERDANARARFRIRIARLAGTERVEWNKKQFRNLGSGLFEIKWESANNTPHRALGFDQGDFFVLVIGCTHKDDNYEPRKCKDTALARMKEAQRGEWRSAVFEP